MPDNPLVDWLRDNSEPGPLEDDERPHHRSRRVSSAMAVLGGLWLGLLVVAWQAFGAPAAEPQRASSPPAPGSPEPPALSLPVDADHGPRDERAVAAHAVLAVRTETGGRADGVQRRYVDLAIAERVHWTDGAAVVTVLAYLLEGDEHRWSNARAARYGVAVSRDGDAVTTDAVWPLPAPDLGEPREWELLSDPALAEAARGSLEATGYRGIDGIDLAVHPQLPGVLRVTVGATAPGEAEARTHHVWLDSASADVLGWS